MDKETIVNLICNYKISSAFITAFKTGIFKTIFKEAMSIQNIAEKLELDQDRLLPLMLYLKEIDLVEESKGMWKVKTKIFEDDSSFNKYEDIINHESNIFNNWMHPEELENALHVSKEKRRFDLEGFTKKEQDLYDKTMYGTNLKVIALHLMREIRAVKNPVILEYGRSRDKVLTALKSIGFKFQGYCIAESNILNNENLSWDGGYKLLKETEEDVKFDAMLLYNGIHYYDREMLRDKLANLKKKLKEDALIIIIDLFYHEGDNFSSGILIDWITHGGVNFLTVEDTKKEFEENGFKLVKNMEIKNINCSILIFK